MLMPRRTDALPTIRRLPWGGSSTTVVVNDRPVTVEWSRAAAKGLADRGRPLFLELELLFSCLVKKSVHVHDTAPAGTLVTVTDDLLLCFRPVTATACTMELADRLGRQPVTPIDTPAARKLGPRLVRLDRAHGEWRAEFWV